MDRSKVFQIAGLVVVFLFFHFSGAFAENIRIGSLAVHPFVTGSVGYSDNVFLTDDDEESDVFFLLSPGVRFTLPSERYAFNLDYTLDYYDYTDLDKADRLIHNATGVIDLNPYRRLDIRIKDEFTRGADPPDFEGGKIARYYWNSASVDGTYDITSRLAVGAGYEYAFKSYDRDRFETDDYDQNNLLGRFYYRVLPKTSLVLAYRYEDRDYDNRSDTDSETNRLEGGVTWEFGAKSVGTVLVGYMVRDYDDLDRDDDAFSYSVNITHQLRPKTTLTLEGVREVQDTSTADENIEFSNSYTSTQIGATLAHRYRKLTGRLGLRYIHDDYNHDDIDAGKDRDDDLFIGEVGLDHAFRTWLKVGGTYRFTTLNSNFDEQEYTENSFLIYLAVIL